MLMSKVLQMKTPLDIRQLILFVLDHCEPNMGVKKLNKLAFFLEFTYIFHHTTPLTEAKYAAINMGPVVDNYKDILADMVSREEITVNDRCHQGLTDYIPLQKSIVNDPAISNFLLQVLEKYKRLNPKQLEDLSHALDSYNITIHENSNNMGGIIDKDLAMLDYSLSLDAVE